MTTRARSGGVPARRGRGSGRGRGNAHAPRSTNREARRTPTRARARSAAPLRGGGTDATEMAALREQIETMKTSLDAAKGPPAGGGTGRPRGGGGGRVDLGRRGADTGGRHAPSRRRNAGGLFGPDTGSVAFPVHGPRHQRPCEGVSRSLAQPPDPQMLDPDRGATHRRQP